MACHWKTDAARSELWKRWGCPKRMKNPRFTAPTNACRRDNKTTQVRLPSTLLFNQRATPPQSTHFTGIVEGTYGAQLYILLENQQKSNFLSLGAPPPTKTTDPLLTGLSSLFSQEITASLHYNRPNRSLVVDSKLWWHDCCSLVDCC